MDTLERQEFAGWDGRFTTLKMECYSCQNRERYRPGLSMQRRVNLSAWTRSLPLAVLSVELHDRKDYFAKGLASGQRLQRGHHAFQ